MKIHHLSCGTCCPVCQRALQGRGSWLAAAQMPCHCLLIEDKNGLVLVDTGFGTPDVAKPTQLGRGFLATMRPTLKSEETAVAQVQALGYHVSDVRHIVPTHLDLDHAGGLPDFAHAKVHVSQAEKDAALQRASLPEKSRYRPHQFAHRPDWQTYQPSSQSWFGFEGVQQVQGLDTEILIVPLLGHSRGHSAIAVNRGDKWLLHVGDLYFDRRTLTQSAPKMMQIAEQMVAFDNHKRLTNVRRVAQLLAQHSDHIEVFCAHDPVELARYQ